jgi:hypothetical protein
MPMTRAGNRRGPTVRATVVTLLLTLFALLAAVPAGAQTTYPPTTPTPTPSETPSPRDEVSPKVVSAGSEDRGEASGSTEGDGVLAFTGADLSVLLTAVAGLIGVGTVLLVAARRRARITS